MAVQGPFKKKICEWRWDSHCEACFFVATRLGHVCVGNCSEHGPICH
jgi:hypothetical protein